MFVFRSCRGTRACVGDPTRPKNWGSRAAPWTIVHFRSSESQCRVVHAAPIARETLEQDSRLRLNQPEAMAPGGKSCVRRPVSRVLSRPLAGPWTAIHLGRPLPDASRDLPGRRGGNAVRRRRSPEGNRPAGRPYAVLLPVGFALPPPLPAARCALTAPFHPCLPAARAADRRYVSVALSLRSPSPGVTRHRVPVEPGLSSPRPSPAGRRPSGRLTQALGRPARKQRQPGPAIMHPVADGR
jgi:hypothetical protein